MATNGPRTLDRVQKVLIFGDIPRKYLEEWQITADLELAGRRLGLQFERVPMEDFLTRFRDLSDRDRKEAKALARELVEGAEQEGRPRPDDEEIEKAARSHIAMSWFVRERRADAVAVNCGPFIQDKDLPVPCVALTLLQDQGIPAACQVDVDALLTMTLFKRAAGWISFMGGAWEDNGRVAVCHCVLSRRMRGPEAPMQAYYLSDYHGRRPSPTIHTDLPSGQVVTLARLTRNLERLILARGTVVDSQDTPEGSKRCRNTLLVKVADLPRLISAVPGVQYHLVAACGDHVRAMEAIAAGAGIEVFAV